MSHLCLGPGLLLKEGVPQPGEAEHEGVQVIVQDTLEGSACAAGARLEDGVELLDLPLPDKRSEGIEPQFQFGVHAGARADLASRV